MNSDFSRILSLLRKEKNISQKKAAEGLGVSQALLSHYEKGIRECGLGFLVRCADFYGVSCDYLLGRTPDRDGSQITVENIPEPDALGKDKTYAGSILPVLNKKLIANSLNILFDLLAKTGSDGLTRQVSNFMMLSVYRMFRVVYSAHPKNKSGMFVIGDQAMARQFANGKMEFCEAKANAIASGGAGCEKIKNVETLAMSTESLSKDYPLFASSLLNLISNTEKSINIENDEN